MPITVCVMTTITKRIFLLGRKYFFCPVIKKCFGGFLKIGGLRGGEKVGEEKTKNCGGAAWVKNGVKKTGGVRKKLRKKTGKTNTISRSFKLPSNLHRHKAYRSTNE